MHVLWVDLACLLLHVVLLLLCFSVDHTGRLMLLQASCTYFGICKACIFMPQHQSNTNDKDDAKGVDKQIIDG